MIELIQQDPAMPVHWGKNQPGMSAKEECNAPLREVCEVFYDLGVPNCSPDHAWLIARNNAIHVAQEFAKAGYHKQIVGRLLEPFVHIKTIVTATEFDNFFALRDHPDAQPEIAVLARAMKQATELSVPLLLGAGQWHVPYYGDGSWKPVGSFAVADKHDVTLDDALAVSASCCAQVSYRRLDQTIEKARMIYNRLAEATPPHLSPFEHQATPFFGDLREISPFRVPGVTAVTTDDWKSTDSTRHVWSGNFRSWIQRRQLMTWAK